MKALIRSPYEALLVEALVSREAADYEAIAKLYAQCQENKLFDWAEEHECASILAARLLAIGKASSRWEEALKVWKYRLIERMAELDALAQSLKEEGIAVIALKNAGIARALYPYPEECPMGDFDILVKRSDFERAHRLILARGYALGSRAKEVIEEESLKAGLRSGGCEYGLDMVDDKLWLELQWRSVAGRWIAPEVEVQADSLFETALDIPGSALLLQDPVSNLLQVSLHTAKHSYVRAPGLRLHSDVDRIVRAYPDFDWESFCQRVEAMQVKTAVYFSLRIPASLLRTPIPPEVLARLEPSVAKRRYIEGVLAKVGLFHPHERKFSRLAYLAFNAALFDNFGACWHSAFPSPDYMLKVYPEFSRLQLPWLYVKRFMGLLFRRVQT